MSAVRLRHYTMRGGGGGVKTLEKEGTRNAHRSRAGATKSVILIVLLQSPSLLSVGVKFCSILYSFLKHFAV